MKTRRNAGITLVELTVAVAIQLGLVGAMLAVADSSTDAYDVASTKGTLEETGRSALESLVKEVRMADVTTLLLATTNGQESLRINIPEPGAPGTFDWSTPIQFLVLPSPIDSNRNGVQDEGMLVRVQDGRQRVLCHHVPQSGVDFQQDGLHLKVSLTLRKVDREGKTVETTVRTSVRIRNNTTGGTL